MLEDFPSDMGGISKTLAANPLFTNNEECDILDEDKAQLFHYLVTMLLYLCRHTNAGIPDRLFQWP